MEKYGFVYLWRDRKHNKYYIGSHWGTETDGYICSSRNMREAFKRRGRDFKRRILSKIYSNREDLLKEEQRFLDMIKKEEFGRRYYNISSSVKFCCWWMNEETKKQVAEKLSKATLGRVPANKGKTIEELHGPERAAEIRRKSAKSQFKPGDVPFNKGKTIEELHGPEGAAEIRRSNRNSHLGKRCSSETEFKRGCKPWNDGLSRIPITNGTENKVLYDLDAVIPPGWWRGVTRSDNYQLSSSCFKAGHVPHNSRLVSTPHGVFSSIAEAARSIGMSDFKVKSRIINTMKHSDWKFM